MPFGAGVKPRLAASSRACRAVIAAREESPELGYAALRAIQLMQFTTSGLLDDDDDLRGALETVDGLDAAAVVARIDDPAIVAIYEEDKARTRSAEGRPTHVQNRHSESDGPVRYTAPTVIFEMPDGRWLEVGGFQPFESYDNALANLDPSLERRPAPERAADAVLAFPIGLTTAEVAAIMRGSDLGRRRPPRRRARTDRRGRRRRAGRHPGRHRRPLAPRLRGRRRARRPLRRRLARRVAVRTPSAASANSLGGEAELAAAVGRDEVEELAVLADVVGDEGAERHHLEVLVAGVAQRPVDDLPAMPWPLWPSKVSVWVKETIPGCLT